jgi:hypothetical protein
MFSRIALAFGLAALSASSFATEQLTVSIASLSQV